MASRRTTDNHEMSDDETEDEDYAPDDEESEEEYGEADAAAAESPEVEVLAVVSGGDETGEISEIGGEEEVEAVNGTGRRTGRMQDFEESSSGIEAELRVDTDTSCLPSCPICFIPWTTNGPHRVCCIPCGHVYGRSCLEKWIKQCKRNAAKCPQCSARFKKTEMINLYAPLIAVSNYDLEKEVLSLRKKNESLILERDCLMEEISNIKKMAYFEDASTGITLKRSRHLDEGWTYVGEPILENSSVRLNNLNANGSSHHICVLQDEIPVDGARALGIDASSQILIVSGKKPGQDGEHVLTKISLVGRHEKDQIQLPPNTGAVRDLCILPGRVALVASLGKKLSLLSMLSNNLVLKYDLPVPAWSCSGDVNEPYHIYAGLQNGMLLIFDIRQTRRCLESIEGLSRYPIHTLCSLQQNNCSRRVLSASSVGPCLWDVGGLGERPHLIPELESQGVCISLACSSSSSDIVASFRPKFELPVDPMPSYSPSQAAFSAGKNGAHVHLRRINGGSFRKGCAGGCQVSQVRMPKSAIVSGEGKPLLFAYGDELTHGVCLWSLPSFRLHSRHPPHQNPILDVKYSGSVQRSGFLACASDNMLQIFACSYSH